MINPRKYGRPPYNIAVVHGGPGAAGDVAPVARKISLYAGVLEPLQTALSVRDQVEELSNLLLKNAVLPLNLVGHSWGAWLSIMLAARHPVLVKKLILIGCPPFSEHDALAVHVTRMNRLIKEERAEIEKLFAALEAPGKKDRSAIMKRIGKIFSEADSYMPDEDEGDAEVDADIFDAVWPEAAEMRARGELLSLLNHLKCPVTAIHGDHDPHPAAGVEALMKKQVKNSKFILLKKCGHYPWKEKNAKEAFYRIMKEELL